MQSFRIDGFSVQQNRQNARMRSSVKTTGPKTFSR